MTSVKTIIACLMDMSTDNKIIRPHSLRYLSVFLMFFDKIKNLREGRNGQHEKFR